MFVGFECCMLSSSNSSSLAAMLVKFDAGDKPRFLHANVETTDPNYFFVFVVATCLWRNLGSSPASKFCLICQYWATITTTNDTTFNINIYAFLYSFND